MKRKRVKITLENLLANDSALLAMGLDLPYDFFANPAWNEMFWQENGVTYFHPLGKSITPTIGRAIVIGDEPFVFDREKHTFSHEKSGIVLRKVDEQLEITSREDGTVNDYAGTRVVLENRAEGLRADLFSYDIDINVENVSMNGSRMTSYFDPFGVERKRDEVESCDVLPLSSVKTKKKLMAALYSTDIVAKYASRFDGNLEVLPSYTTKATRRRNIARPDLVFITTMQGIYMYSLLDAYDTRIISTGYEKLVEAIPEALEEDDVAHFIESARGPMETRISLAKLFGCQGKSWLAKNEVTLKKD